MKDYKKSLTSSKEKPSVTGVRKEEDVTSPTNKSNEIQSLTGQLEKKEEKGDDIMGMEEDFKVFMKEQEKFNKSLGTFVEGLTRREEQQAEGTRVREQIKSEITPLEKKVSQQGKVLEELQKQLEPFGKVCTSVEECQVKLKELEKAPPEEEPEGKLTGMSYDKLKELSETGNLEARRVLEERMEKLGGFTAQEKYDSIKIAPTALSDLDNLYTERFAEDPEYRKQALEKLPDEVFVELAKDKAIETKLTALCNDEVCRTDVVAKIKKVEKSTGKKLLKG